MLENKLREEGLDCCIDEVGEMIQQLTSLLKVFERKEIVSEGFTISQCYIMIYLLKNNGLTMNEISEKMNLDKSTITRVVGNLVRDGFINKEKSQKDKRVIIASLTEQGLKEANVLQEKVNSYYRDIIRKLPEGEVMNVVKSVNMLRNALKEIKPHCCN